MRASWVVVVLVVCLCVGAQSVQVKVGDRSFPLEAVKELKELMESEEGSGPHLAQTGMAAVCSHPLLPQVFQPVCMGRGAGIVLSTLVHIITPLDFCEMCSNPSCYGCLQ